MTFSYYSLPTICNGLLGEEAIHEGMHNLFALFWSPKVVNEPSEFFLTTGTKSTSIWKRGVLAAIYPTQEKSHSGGKAVAIYTTVTLLSILMSKW